jgi:hypothetical protein
MSTPPNTARSSSGPPSSAIPTLNPVLAFRPRPVQWARTPIPAPGSARRMESPLGDPGPTRRGDSQGTWPPTPAAGKRAATVTRPASRILTKLLPHDVLDQETPFPRRRGPLVHLPVEMGKRRARRVPPGSVRERGRNAAPLAIPTRSEEEKLPSGPVPDAKRDSGACREPTLPFPAGQSPLRVPAGLPYARWMIWVRRVPTDTIRTGVEVISWIRSRYARALAGRSSRERASPVLASQPG